LGSSPVDSSSDDWEEEDEEEQGGGGGRATAGSNLGAAGRVFLAGFQK